jgi:hypothetical protein
MWYQIARLITVQIGLLFSCFCSIAVATIGYVAAMLLVKIKEEEVGGRVKFQRLSFHAEVVAARERKKSAAESLPRQDFLPRQGKSRRRRSDPSGGRRHDRRTGHLTGLPGSTAGRTGS